MNTARNLLGAVLLTSLLVGSAGAYQVQDEYYVYCTHSDGIPIQADEIHDGLAYVAGNYTKTGVHGGYGWAAFEVDLLERSVSVGTHTHGVQFSTYDFDLGTGRVENARFKDRVTFTAAAGTHPNGLYVTMTGFVRGSISSDIGAGVQAHCYANLGALSYDSGALYSGIDEASSVSVDDDFTLVLEIVAPGTTLNNPLVVAHDIQLGFYNGIAWSVSLNTAAGYVTGDSNIDFTDGLHLDPLHGSPGVTWVSESGAFEGGVSAVPDAPVTSLRQNVPNPFNPRTEIRWSLAASGPVDLFVYDLSGRRVRTLFAGAMQPAGPGQVTWTGRDDAGREAAAGVYLYRLRADGVDLQRRMTLVR